MNFVFAEMFIEKCLTFLASFVLILYFDWLLCIHVPDSSLYIICVFYSSRIRTLVAMVTLSFHRLIMGKVEISYFLKTIAA